MVKKIQYRFRVLKELNKYAVGVRGFFLIKIFLSALSIGMALIAPYLYGQYIQRTILGKHMECLVWIVGIYIGTQLLSTVLALLNNKCTYTINNKVTVAVRTKIMRNRFQQKFQFYTNLNVGNEKMIFDDAVGKMCDFCGIQTIDYFLLVLQVVTLTFMLLVMEWHLAILMIISIPISFWINHLNGKAAKENNQQTWNNDRAWGDWIFTSINAWKEIRAMQMEERCEENFDEYSKKYSKLFRVYTRFWVTRRFTIPKIKEEFLMQFLLIFVGGVLICKGNITIGSLLAFSQYYSILTSSLQTVINTDTDLQINSVHYDKVLKELEWTDEEAKNNGYKPQNYDIKVDNVTFRYPEGNVDILKDFSLTIPKGDRVGIVGQSGAGKSTLLNLLVGVLEPTDGRILIDGHDLREINQKVLHQKVGFILQEGVLFNTTIRENLLYGKEDATQEEIEKACERACVKEFIESLPNKYDTEIGEKGTLLSGGQRQRIILARAFLKDVDIFVFDEATSALDQHTENLIQNAISNINKDKTIIVVSHRESSLEICNRRVLIE